MGETQDDLWDSCSQSGPSQFSEGLMSRWRMPEPQTDESTVERMPLQGGTGKECVWLLDRGNQEQGTQQRGSACGGASGR
jgi:hypothetical protein